MSTAWTAKAIANLLPLSVSPELAEALREWAYTGNSTDYGQPEETCQLCDHEDLRYHFEIANRLTAHRLWVGSKCIQRFEIDGYEQVKVDLAGLIKSAEERRVRELLVTVADRTEGRVDLVAMWEERGGISPRQALRLAKACWRLHITPVSFPKVRLQRHSDRTELRRMTEWERGRIAAWMPAKTLRYQPSDVE